MDDNDDFIKLCGLLGKGYAMRLPIQISHRRRQHFAVDGSRGIIVYLLYSTFWLSKESNSGSFTPEDLPAFGSSRSRARDTLSSRIGAKDSTSTSTMLS